MQNLNHPWSAKEDAKLVKLRASGVDYRQISALLGRTNDACRTRFKMLRRHAVNELGEILAEEVEQNVAVEEVDSVQSAILDSVEEVFQEQEDDLEENERPESKTWTQEDLEALYELRKANVPYSLIAADLKRSAEACKAKYCATDWSSLGFVTEEDKWDNEEFAVRKAVFRDRILRAADRRHESHKIGLDLLGDRLERAIKSLPVIAPTRWNPNRIKTASKEEDVVCMLSDIHIGAEHSLEETGGISYYNFERMSSRILNLQYGVRDIVELHSHMYRLPKMHGACLGDIVAGDNSSGEWSQNYISMPIVEQVISGYAKIRDMLAYWLTIFDNITFYGVRGNHGRTGKRGVEKDYSNYDYLCYKFLEESFRNNPRIKFVVPKTWWILAEIRNHKLLMVHGDDIGNGTPPIKKLSDFQSKMGDIVGEKPKYTLAGHFHNTAELGTNSGSVLINGSFVGGDIFSLKNVHANSRPEQTIFGMNNSRGKTWKYNIDLDDTREPG